MYQVIGGPGGDPAQALSATPFSPDEARALYRSLVRARRVTEGSEREGRGTGREAAQVGAVEALAERDWLVPTHDHAAALLTRGDVPERLRDDPGDADRRVFPPAAPRDGHLPHAVGLGMAARYREAADRVLALLDARAVAGGDFHEALNVAGVFDAPVVFCCLCGDDHPTAAESVADAADAYGLHGFRVDGDDPLAVAETVGHSLAVAADDAPVLVEVACAGDGLDRFEAYLREEGVIDAEFVAGVEADVERELDGLAPAEPDPEAVFDHAYADLPGRVREQRDSRRA